MYASEASELKTVFAFILRIYHVLTIKLLQFTLLTGSLINQLNYCCLINELHILPLK